MKKKLPIAGKYYVIQLKPDIISSKRRRVLAVWMANSGYWQVLNGGRSVDVENVVNYWLLPPDGEPLG